MNSYGMVELGTLIKQAKNVRCGNADYPVLSMTMNNGLVFQDDKFKKVIASKDQSAYKVVSRNQLVVSFPIDEGVLAAQRITDAGIVSPAYRIWDINKQLIMPEFLECALRCNRALEYYKARLRGSTARRRSLPTPTLLAFTVPLPSIGVQREILEIVHKAKDVIASRKQQLSTLDTFVRARFVEMFGEPATNPRRWSQKDMNSICTKITDGEHGSVLRVESGYLFLNAKHIRSNGSINFGTATYISDDAHDKIYKRCNPEQGDILLTTTGTIGNVAIVPAGREFSMDRGITLLKIDKTEVESKFVAELLRFRCMQAIMNRNVHASAIGHLFLNQVAKLPIIVPPLELQQQFAAFVAQADKSKVVLVNISG